jgi:predicted dehydrogenase
MNWALGAHPVSCIGVGGREVRKGPDYGNIYDHFSIEYAYPEDVRISAMCRQIDSCTDRISDRVVGSKGLAYLDGATAKIQGDRSYEYDGPVQNPQVQEHADMIAAIRAGQPLNHGKRIAESTLTAIIGRMSAYTGRALKWDWALKASKLDLSPPHYAFSDLPVRPIAVPGKTKLT